MNNTNYTGHNTTGVTPMRLANITQAGGFQTKLTT